MVDPCARHDSNVRPLLPLGAGCRPRSLRDAAQSSSGISFSTTPGPSRRGAQSGASSIETPTLRSHCYGLLRTILGTAASDGKLAANPCNVKGAGNTKRVEKMLAAWCAMRFGELTELRRRDLVLDPDQGKGVIRIERAVVRTDGGSRPRRPRATPGLVMSPSRRT